MAYNRKAWEIAQKFTNNIGGVRLDHHLTVTGPCCEICRLAYYTAEEALHTSTTTSATDKFDKFTTTNDDPTFDATDLAHPAWWRGHEYSFTKLCQEVNAILDGKKENVGTATNPWQQLRQRLYDIRTLLGVAENIINTVNRNTKAPGMCRSSIVRWYKIRNDYAARLAILAVCHGDPGDEHEEKTK